MPRGPARVVWQRSTRARRVSLRIDSRRAAVVVTLPVRERRAAGLRFLISQSDWVSERLVALPPAVVFADGVAVVLNGEPYRIRHRPDLDGAPRLREGELEVAGRPDHLAARVCEFLRREARRMLAGRVAAQAGVAGVLPRRILVKDTISRWGSCAPDGTLAFSWRLVMAPGYVQDYVTGHEVAHLRHLDHGPRFWRLVDALTPYRTTAVAWLKDRGPGLLRIG